MFDIHLEESTGYRKQWSRGELTDLLAGHGYDRAALDRMDDTEFADTIAAGRPGCVEDAMQRYGDVSGTTWTVRPLPDSPGYGQSPDEIADTINRAGI